MIKVKVDYQENRVSRVTVKGHANYDDYGKDIVCSAVSSIVYTALLGIKEFSSAKVEYTVKEKQGLMDIIVPQGKTEVEEIKIQAVIETAVIGLRDLEKGYKAYLQVEV